MIRDEAIEYLKRADITVGQKIKTRTAEALEMAIEALKMEHSEDIKDALHIVQTDRDKWKARAQKLAKIIGIRDCDIDEYEHENCTDCISRQAVINTLFYLSDNNCDVVLSTELMERINRLPSVMPRQEPCEEREKGECPFYAG